MSSPSTRGVTSVSVPKVRCPRLCPVTLSEIDPRVASTTENLPRPLALDALRAVNLAACSTDDT